MFVYKAQYFIERYLILLIRFIANSVRVGSDANCSHLFVVDVGI